MVDVAGSVAIDVRVDQVSLEQSLRQAEAATRASAQRMGAAYAPAAKATNAVSISAARMAEALRATGGDLSKVTPGMVGLADATARTSAANAAAATSLARTNTNLRTLNATAGQSVGVLGSLRGVLASLGLALGAQQLVHMTSVWTDYTSRIRVAVGSTERARAVMERLNEMAQRTYSTFENTAESFLLNSTVLKELGYSTKTQLDFTEALSNALVVSGTKGERAASVIYAMSRAMATGQLRGQELTQVIQTSSRVAQALADGLGVTTLELKAMGAAGEITTQKTVSAMVSQLEKLRAEAESMPVTIEDAFLRLRNSLLRYVGVFDGANKVSATFAAALDTVAANMNIVAGVVTAALIPALVQLTITVTTLTAAMLRNPFVLVATAIAAVIGLLVAYKDEIITVANQTIRVGNVLSAVWTTVYESIALTVRGLGQLAAVMGQFQTMNFHGALEFATQGSAAQAESLQRIIDSWRDITSGKADKETVIGDIDDVDKLVAALGAMEKVRGAMDRVRDNILGLQVDLKTLDWPVARAAAYRIEIELANAAIKAGTEMTPELRDEIKGLAAEFGALTYQLGVAQDVKNAIQGIRDQTSALRLQAATLGMSAAAAAAYRAEQSAINSITNKGGVLLEKQAEDIRRAAKALGEATGRTQAAANIRDRQQALQLTRMELALVGQSEDVHARVLARMRAENEIRQLGIDSTGEQAQAIRRLAEEQAAYDAQLQKTRAAFDEVKRVGEGAIDTLTDALLTGVTDWRTVVRSVLQDITKSFVTLSLTNPLKNLLYGGNLPTMDALGGPGGFFSALFGGGPPRSVVERGTLLNPMYVIPVGGVGLGVGASVLGTLGTAVGASGALSPAALPSVLGTAAVGTLGVAASASGAIPLASILPLILGSATSAGSASGLGRLVSPLLGAGTGGSGTSNALFDLIRRGEGTAGPGGYNTTLGYGAFTGGPTDLVSMTLNQVRDLQRTMLANPLNTFNSSAVGAYQITGRTLEGLMGKLNLSGSELFTPELQDKLAAVLALQRGSSASALSNEWEGLRGFDPGQITEAFQRSTTSLDALAKGATSASAPLQSLGGIVPASASSLTEFTRATTSAVEPLGDLGAQVTNLIPNLTSPSRGIPGLFSAANDNTAVSTATTSAVSTGITSQLGGLFQSLLGGISSLLSGLIGNLANLLPTLLGGLFSGGGGLLGSLGGLFGFEEGGFTGQGGPGDPRGVVHAGEIVWSRGDIHRAGGVGVVESMRTGRMRGYAEGGVVPPNLPAAASSFRAPAPVVSSARFGAAPQADKAVSAREIAREVAAKVQLNTKIVNVFDPAVVGDYLRTAEGESLIMNVARRNGIAA